MPEETYANPTVYDALGPFPLILAAAFALAIIALLVVGIIKRKHRDSIDRCLLLLFVVAGIAFLTGVVRAATHSSMIHEMLSRAGVAPYALAFDRHLIEWERLFFSWVALFGLLAAGLLILFRKPYSADPS